MWRWLKAAWRAMVHGTRTWLYGLLPRTKIDYRAEIGDGQRSNVVMAPVLWMARTFPEAPIGVGETAEEIDTEHSMCALIRRPNGFYSGTVLWMASVISLTTDGNGYWIKIRNGQRKPIQLWYAPHWTMEPQSPDDGSEFITGYRYSPGRGAYSLEVEDVVHLRYGMDPENPRKGLSPLKSLFREIFTDEEASAFTATMLRNAGVPGLVISPSEENGEIISRDKRAIKKWFREKFGADRRGEPLVASGKMDVRQFGFSPEEMNLARLRQIPEERVAAVLGIPAAVVGFGTGLEQTKVGATMKELREMAYESCIIPMQRIIADQIEQQLYPDFAVRDGLHVAFDLSRVRILQEDQNRLAERYDRMVQGGWMTVADAKRALNAESYPGDEVYLRKVNVVPVPVSRGDEATEEERESERQGANGNGQGKSGRKLVRAVVLKQEWHHRLAEALRKDELRLAEQWDGELVDLFEDLGERTAEAWMQYATERGWIEAQRGGKPVQVKLEMDLDFEELPDIVNAVILRVKTDILTYEQHYLRVARQTVETINLVTELGVNLSEPAEVKLLSAAQERKALIDMERQTKDAMFDALALAREEGRNPLQIAQTIKEEIPAGPWSTPRIRAEVISRTETKYAQNAASIEAYQTADTVSGLVIVDGQLGERSCEHCIELDGTEIDFDEADYWLNEEHPNGTRSFSPLVREPEHATA